MATQTAPINSLATLSGAQMLIQVLKEHGVDTVFGYPGGAILPVYDALDQQDTITHILVRHEQAAIHAAQGYSRVTGKIGVAIVTSGPGITNAVTGLTDALMDSTPIVCISGQVPTALIGSDAFQECDATGITRPATKYNTLIATIDSLCQQMHEAFLIATTGRPGPVHIDIPKDVQIASSTYVSRDEILIRPQLASAPKSPNVEGIKHIAEMIKTAQRPIVYGGGGLINASGNTCLHLRRIVEQLNLPTTLTLMGLGALPSDHPNFLGMLGMHGSLEANLAMYNADLIIALGARFDDRVTGNVAHFSPNSRRVQIDVDPSSINKCISVDVGVVGSLDLVLPVLSNLLGNTEPVATIDQWWEQINQWRSRNSFSYERSDTVIKPQEAIRQLARIAASDQSQRGIKTYITTEVGQHQMWAAQYFPYTFARQWVTSGGLGTMGFGLPAAIGMQLGVPNGRVVNIAGDASILMCIQELSTAIQYSLPVKVMILNNQYMGMVRQWQDLLHEGRRSQSYTASLPNFAKLAEAFGAMGVQVEKPGDLTAALEETLNDPRPTLIDVRVDQSENCLPMIPSGSPHNEMILPGHDQSTQPQISAEGSTLV